MESQVQETINEIENENQSDNLESNQEPEIKQPETQESESDGLITEEIAKQYGLSKTFIGKPLIEGIKSYSELLKLDGKRANEIAELRKQVEALKVTPKEQQKAEQQTENELGDMPDPLDDPKGFSDWMKRRDEILLENAEKRIEAKYKDKFETAEQVSTESLMNKTFQLVQTGLPEDEDVQAVIADYMEENKEYYQELIEMGRGRTPEQISREILKDYKAKMYDKQSKLTQEEIEQKASEKAQSELLKKTKNTKVSNMNTNQRETKRDSEVSKLVAELEANKDQGD